LSKHPCWLGGPLSNLLQNGADSPASVSGSFLDCTASPDKLLDGMYLMLFFITLYEFNSIKIL